MQRARPAPWGQQYVSSCGYRTTPEFRLRPELVRPWRRRWFSKAEASRAVGPPRHHGVKVGRLPSSLYMSPRFCSSRRNLIERTFKRRITRLIVPPALVYICTAGSDSPRRTFLCLTTQITGTSLAGRGRRGDRAADASAGPTIAVGWRQLGFTRLTSTDPGSADECQPR